MKQLLNTFLNNTNGRLPIFKFDLMHQNQGRTFGSLLGLFLVNLFARAVTGKFDSYLSYTTNPWFNFYKPYPKWYPIDKPSSYQAYPILTTTTPYITSQIPFITTEAYYYDDYYSVTPNPNNIKDLIPAESNLNPRRNPPPNYRRRPLRRDKYSQKRRRTTSPPFDYYYSNEDYSYTTERYRPNRRTRPPPNRYQSSELYYDDDEDDYYDSFEATTKYYKKQKRRPTRKTNKNQNRKQIANGEIPLNQRIDPQTEIVIVRQAMTTTTEPTTLITNGTTMASSTASSANTTTNATGYGYGPSNGNENISFTYGPPISKYQYTIPYIDWYTQEATRNAIVKRVRDIVNLK